MLRDPRHTTATITALGGAGTRAPTTGAASTGSLSSGGASSGASSARTAADPGERRTAAPPATLADAARRRLIRGRTRQLALATADIATVGVILGIVAASSAAPIGLPTGGIAVSLVIWLAVFHVYGLYAREPHSVLPSTLDEVPRVFHASLVASIVSWITFAALGGSQLAWSLGSLIVAGVVLVPLARIAARWVTTFIVGPDRILLIGSGSATVVVRASLAARRDITVVGDEPLPDVWHRREGDDPNDYVRSRLGHLVLSRRIDRVLLSTRDLGDRSVAEFVAWARQTGVNLTVMPEHFDVVGLGATIDQVRGATVVSLQPPMLSWTANRIKRGLDVVGSLCGLVLLSPVLVAIAIAISVDSRGGVIFRQSRIGRGGKRFDVLKFRTMVPNADAMVEDLMARSTDPHWLQIEDDPRVTRVGRFLRSTSLDELPQLWNVLRGDMSLVGPRPLSARDDARVDGWARGRLDLTPGLTGLWQVLGRKSVPFAEMVQLDYVYVANWSLWGDIKLLLQTLPAVFRGDGAR
ncbi:MAG: sugar transferase [Solirubrobacteraceae bacterium]|nr:sugar transferase [Solirubrobacteraceae bacterium]